jgi:hypothetical protein
VPIYTAITDLLLYEIHYTKRILRIIQRMYKNEQRIAETSRKVVVIITLIDDDNSFILGCTVHDYSTSSSSKIFIHILPELGQYSDKC